MLKSDKGFCKSVFFGAAGSLLLSASLVFGGLAASASNPGVETELAASVSAEAAPAVKI